ncbi:MAG TPA: hypothetical protein PKC67_02410 [Kiritimatiellia bacterium]|nr:hypothetical protein [Kiritimatiellia bacterium]HMP33178.1 hypothetical protein [Kiritimatiellia bacterium]
MNILARLARRAFELLHLLALLLIPLILAACTSGCASNDGGISTKAFSVVSGTVDGSMLNPAAIKENHTMVYNRYSDSLAADRNVDLTSDVNFMAAAKAGDAASLFKYLSAKPRDTADALINKNRALHEQIIVTPSASAATAISAAFFATRTERSVFNYTMDTKLNISDSSMNVMATNAPPVPPPPYPVDTNTTPELPDASLDALDISNAILLGTHANVNPAIADTTRLLTKSDITDGKLALEYEKLNWPLDNKNPEGVDSRIYIFWKEDNQVYGGHFEWKRPDQNVKLLENIFANYLGRKPPSGSDVWFCLVKNDGTQRTNVLKSNTPFP